MENRSPYDLLQNASTPFSQLTYTGRFDRWREIQSVPLEQRPVETAPAEPQTKDETQAEAASAQPVVQDAPAQEDRAPSAAPPVPRPSAPALKPRRNYYDGIIKKHTLASHQTVFIPVTKS